MASMVYCEVCDKRNKTSIAKTYCSDCDDKLCSECLEFHAALKSCVNHHIVDVSILTEQSLFVNKYCERHTDLLLEFYCSDHDVICCRSCMADDHRTCGKIKPVEIASKDIKSSNMLEETLKQVCHLKETSGQMLDEVKKSRKLINDSKVDCIEKVSKLNEELHKRIDVLASNCISEINVMNTKLLEKVDLDEAKVKKKVKTVQDTKEKFEYVVKHGSDRHIFLHLNSIKIDIHNIDTALKELVPALKIETAEFEKSDIMTMLKCLGTVTRKERPCDFQYKPVKQEQAQGIINVCPAPTSFQLEKKVTFVYDKKIWISGMCVTKNDQIILCDWAKRGNALLVLTNKGQVIRKIAVEYRPWNIAIEPDTVDAWVTQPSASYIQVLDTTSLILKHRVNVSEQYYGITFVGIEIAVGKRGKVDLISKQGVWLKSFNVGNNIICSLCYTGLNKVYCCDPDSDMFHCISIEGKHVFSYKCQGPVCVSADHHGNVYVLCWKSDNLHVLTGEGKHLNVILHSNDRLTEPYAACFNKKCSKLFITNHLKTEVLVFECN